MCDCFVLFLLQFEENRGLRLKDSIVQRFLANDEFRRRNEDLVRNGSSFTVSQETSVDDDENLGSRISRGIESFFDEAGYVARGALIPGENPYNRNKFNQAASDKLPSNRPIPDTRVSECVPNFKQMRLIFLALLN